MLPTVLISDGRAAVSPKLRTLCLCATWIHVVRAFPQGGTPSNASITRLIPSYIPIPSAPLNPQPSSASSPPSSANPGMPSSFVILPSSSSIVGPISGAPIPSAPNTSGQPLTPIAPPMESTDEPLRPIPPATTGGGDPNGHHEITEPNLTATAPCRGCSPVVEVSVTGFDSLPTSPAAEQAGSSAVPPARATVTAGDTEIVVTKAPQGTNFVVGSSTVAPGQTVTINHTPVAVQTSGGQAQVVVGTKTVPLVPSSPESAQGQITEAPILSPLIVAGQTITANEASQFVIGSQTLVAGGPAITVSGTTISLLPSATAVVINGVTSTLAQGNGGFLTTTAPALLTFNNHIYTANRAGYYILGPGTTLIPGGPAVTVSGTAISLEPHGTAAIIAGSTSLMTPMSTIVTLTMADRPSSLIGATSGGTFAQSTAKHSSAGVSSRAIPVTGLDGVIEGLFLLAVLGFGWLAVWL